MLGLMLMGAVGGWCAYALVYGAEKIARDDRYRHATKDWDTRS